MANDHTATLANSKPSADFLARHGIPSGMYDEIAEIFTGPIVTWVDGLPLFVRDSVFIGCRSYFPYDAALDFKEKHYYTLCRMGISPWVAPDATCRHIANLFAQLAYEYRQSDDKRSLTARPARV